jgi:hypothetical protein
LPPANTLAIVSEYSGEPGTLTYTTVSRLVTLVVGGQIRRCQYATACAAAALPRVWRRTSMLPCQLPLSR